MILTHKFVNLFVTEFKEEFAKIKNNSFKEQIPNILTFSRALAPLIVVPTILTGRLDIAVLEVVLFELTDFIDGKLARKMNCVTGFGIKFDAVCDKIFVIGIMIPAIIKYPILLINLIMEFIISYINIMSELKNNNPKSSILGKIKTAFLAVTLILAYAPCGKVNYFLIVALLTLILQIWTSIRYKIKDTNEDNKKT